MGREVDLELSVDDGECLKEGDMGGVVLYCNRFRTIFTNTLRSRFELGFENGTPDIRRLLFPSLAYKKKGKSEEKASNH